MTYAIQCFFRSVTVERINIQTHYFKDEARKETAEIRQNKSNLEEMLKRENEETKNALKKQQQEVQNRERRMNEHEMKIKHLEKERNELKGDIAGGLALHSRRKIRNSMLFL